MRILNFKIILQFCVVGLLMVSCSNDLLDSDSTQEAHSKEKFRKVNSWQDQIALLDQKMQRFHNFAVAQAQGYTVQAGPYVPNMGYHYLNPEYVDGEFDLLKPEILVYHPDENGNMIFGAAEYLIPLMDCDEENPSYPAPEGFMGNEITGASIAQRVAGHYTLGSVWRIQMVFLMPPTRKCHFLSIKL